MRELEPLLEATNTVMAQLRHLLNDQKRFVRDTAHQLRSPLAVMKTQVQSALRDEANPKPPLHEIETTIDRATTLTNQMLSLAKVEQLRLSSEKHESDLYVAAKAVSLELAPLVVDKDINFEVEGADAAIRCHEWMLHELTRNLLHNAIKHTPPRGSIVVQVSREGAVATLSISDSGPGISSELRPRLFQPFSAGDIRTGSGLGLAICEEIMIAVGGSIALENRETGGRICGLEALVKLPLAARLIT